MARKPRGEGLRRAFAAALDAQMKKRGVGTSELAARLGRDKAYVSRVRYGDVGVSTSSAQAFASALKAGPDDWATLMRAANTTIGAAPVEHTCPKCGHKF